MKKGGFFISNWANLIWFSGGYDYELAIEEYVQPVRRYIVLVM